MQRVSHNGFVAFAFGIAIFLAGAAPATAAEFDDAQKAEIEKIVGDYIRNNPDIIADYLRNNPEILLEVSKILKAKQDAQAEEAVANALKAHREQIERHPMTPATGNPKGDVTVVEFFDYNCPYCKKVFEYMTELEEEDPNLRVVWKEFPILGPVSRYAAQVATAADRQGKYMTFHTAAMSGPRLVSKEQVLKLAAKAGLDMAQLEKDLKDPAVDVYLDETIELARALGITGTPGFVVGQEIVSGAIGKDDMKSVIEFTRRQGS